MTRPAIVLDYPLACGTDRTVSQVSLDERQMKMLESGKMVGEDMLDAMRCYWIDEQLNGNHRALAGGQTPIGTATSVDRGKDVSLAARPAGLSAMHYRKIERIGEMAPDDESRNSEFLRMAKAWAL